MNMGFKKLALLGAFFLPFLTACEVGDDLPTAPAEEVTAELDSLELLASSPQMQSDGSTPITLTAIAKDTNNQIVEGVTVIFSANSGTLVVGNATTSDQGTASATLNTGGDVTNRTITVTATAGSLSSTLNIQVIGTSLQIQGPASLALGDSGTYTVTLSDSNGKGVSGKTINISSSAGNGLSFPNLVTDTNGRIQGTLSADNSGTDTLTATALPDSTGQPTVDATFNVSISGDSFRFTSPAASAEILLNTPQNLTVRWEKNGVPQSGQTINFSSTRGALNASSAVTDANGDASVSITASTAGPGVITATNPEGTSTQLSVEFVADDPDAVSLQADPGVIGPNESSTITAIVTDANNNRVKNQTVEFTLEDTTGGQLTTAQAITDSLGRAQTVYQASSATSADDGVKITARIVDPSAFCPDPFDPNTAVLCAQATITVSGQALFITFGTGNSIIEDQADTTYTKNYSLFVSDSSGQGVADTDVSIRMLSVGFDKGYLVANATTNTWVPITNYECESEDLLSTNLEDRNNGILDAGEDLNGDGELTPGNIAVVSPGTVTTDSSGQANFQVSYPQNYALWVRGRITASATVAGTESRKSASFDFPMSADDASLDASPPNPVSPWGDGRNTTNTNPYPTGEPESAGCSDLR